ncbi:hypothetical protein FVR03_16145 [Pontibacter qinzhouensis]|uniref:Uncharacterized protein n=1 Tax=Pontibacter qinzhouensis TaxID=2603253 RepID=A0A5C8JI16_9BACT|nr:hypothetical protein [Pontibacter qinzhouensis]TXK37011.1 hypothetical protein FVR03_16145 [Pontibacter qinzhouensis]
MKQILCKGPGNKLHVLNEKAPAVPGSQSLDALLAGEAGAFSPTCYKWFLHFYLKELMQSFRNQDILSTTEGACVVFHLFLKFS